MPMTNQTSRHPQAATNEDSTALPHRLAAMELLVQNLVFVLDAQGALNADAFADWMAIAIGRMRATGSVPAAETNALQNLVNEVVR